MTSYYTNYANPIMLNRDKRYNFCTNIQDKKHNPSIEGYNLNEILYLNVDKTRNKLLLMKSKYKQQCITNQILKKHYYTINKTHTSPQEQTAIKEIDQTGDNSIIHSTKFKDSHRDRKTYPYENDTQYPQYYITNVIVNRYDQLKHDTINLLTLINDYKMNSTQIEDKPKTYYDYKSKYTQCDYSRNNKKKASNTDAQEPKEKKETQLTEVIALYKQSEIKTKEEFEKLMVVNAELKERVDNLKEQFELFIKGKKRIDHHQQNANNELGNGYQSINIKEGNDNLVNELIEIMDSNNKKDDSNSQEFYRDDANCNLKLNQNFIENQTGEMKPNDDLFDKNNIEQMIYQQTEETPSNHLVVQTLENNNTALNQLNKEKEKAADDLDIYDSNFNI